MLHKKILLLVFAALFFPHANAFASGEAAPSWLQQAAASKNPAYDKDVPAVILLNEQTATLDAAGVMTTTTRYAVRVLLREGRFAAQAGVAYLQKASKVREMRAWLIRPNGALKEFGKDQIIDRIADPNEIYDEYRVKFVDATDDADAGAVFAYESTVEGKPLYTQEEIDLQNCTERFCFPTLVSRHSINLPAGWQATSRTFNHEEIKPQVSGASYVWQMQNLPPVPPEPDSPGVHNIAPRVVVNYFPSGANQHVFDSWRNVSEWYTDLSAASLTVDETVAAKARELTQNAKTELEKIQAIARYAQNIRYISLQIGSANYGGQRPRPANLVLQRGFGDCKDKANLMRAMLKSLKMDSYLVLIYAGDPTFVRKEWASPGQFNHCIIAVRVSDETNAPTVVKHEKLGRLLIFDATDQYTQIGDLPDHEQGSFALVAAGTDGELIRMPILPPDANKHERVAEAALLADGSLQATIKEQAFGQTASRHRGIFRELSAAEYRTRSEGWLTERVTGAKLTKFTPNDRAAEGRFDLDLEFSAAQYAQMMGGRLMVFKPGFVGRLDQFRVLDKPRTHPILLDSSQYSETIRVKLPDGFVVDEMPETDKAETAFGKYSVNYEVKDGVLNLTRTLVLTRAQLPPSEYETVKNFFARVRSAEVAPIVLVKK